MAIDRLTEVTSLDGTEVLPLFSAAFGNDVKLRLENFVAWLQAQGFGGDVTLPGMTDAASVGVDAEKTAFIASLGVAVNDIASASYIMLPADWGKPLRFTSNSSQTFIINSSSLVGVTAGMVTNIKIKGAGGLTWDVSGITFRGNTALAQYESLDIELQPDGEVWVTGRFSSITPVAPVITAQAAATGTPTQGAALTFSSATATGTPPPTITYALVASSNVVIQDNITSGSYVPTAGATGAKIRTTASNAAGDVSGYSAPFNITALTAPGAVTGLTLGTTSGVSQVLTFTDPVSDGGSPILYRVVQYAVAGSGSWTEFAPNTITGSPVTVTGLNTVANAYDFRVAAKNAIGTGAFSNVVTSTITEDLPTAVAAMFAGGFLYTAQLGNVFTDTARTTGAVLNDAVAGITNIASGASSGHGQQATLANRPLLKQDASGFYYLEFDGTNDIIDAMTMTAGANRTAILVGRLRNATIDSCLIAEGNYNTAAGGSWGVYRSTAIGTANYSNKVTLTTSEGKLAGSVLRQDEAAWPDQMDRYVVMVFDLARATSATRNLYLDGAKITLLPDATYFASQTGINTPGTIPVQIGGRNNSSLSGSYAQLDLYAAGVATSVLSAAQRLTIQRWAATIAPALPYHAQPFKLDNITGAVAGDYFPAITQARAVFTTTATKLRLDLASRIYSSLPAEAYVTVDDSTTQTKFSVTAGYAVQRQTDLTLPAGTKTVTVYEGPQSRPDGVANGDYGTWLKHVTANAAIEPVLTDARAITASYGDSISVGSSATNAITQGWAGLLRAAGKRIAVTGSGYLRLKDDADTAPKRAALATRILGTGCSKILITVGTNDYGFGTNWNAADFGAAYSALLAELKAQSPSIVIVCVSPIVRGAEGANSFGDTLGAYRTAVSNAAAANSCTYVDGSTLVTTGDLADGLHPNNAGHVKIANALQTYCA